jgi:hypothetical protein
VATTPFGPSARLAVAPAEFWVTPARGLSIDYDKLEFTIYPAPEVSIANCILATRSMIDDTGCAFMVDNGAPRDVYSRTVTNRKLKPFMG